MILDIIEYVKSEYEREHANPVKPVNAEDLPLSYEDINPEWLTNVLCENHPNCRVVSHRLDEPDPGTTNRRRIFIEYNEECKVEDLPASVFCKATQGLVNRITLGPLGAVENEITFYTKIRPHLDIEAPRCYFGNYNPRSYNSIIMLSDLGKAGVQFCDHKTEITKELAESQLELLATYHGKFHQENEASKMLADLPRWTAFFEKTLAHDFKKTCTDGFHDAKDVIPPSLYRRGHKEVWSATLQCIDQNHELPHTLLHGDPHLKQWYITPTKVMGLTDWQVASRAHWSRDLAYCMSTSLKVEDRRDWERDLVAFYIDRLARAGGQRVSFDDAWTWYRQQLFGALAFWTNTLSPVDTYPDMQPRETAVEFVKRISHAIDDLDALSSFD